MVLHAQGKLEMELELMTEAEALDSPAGRARDDPNQNPTLDPPKSVFSCRCHAATVLIVI